MPEFSAEPVRWKHCPAFRLSNGKIEATVLLGGGHIADLRLCGSEINVLWEAPWPTIDSCKFSDATEAMYGERAVGQMLSGYTGHALALPYFGMPSSDDAKRGLALHGEAACTEWQVGEKSISDGGVSVTLEASLPVSQLRVRRTLRVSADAVTVSVLESVRNMSAAPRDLQWVEHAAFGEPMFSPGESSLGLSGDRGVTWPLGYEGHELLPSDLEFQWPIAKGIDLSKPFSKDGTGFVAAVRVNTEKDAFVAVHSRRLALAAGYAFDGSQFPWIALWEENRARTYPPWNGRTRVRGVEFGTSPMPLGLEHAQRMGRLLDRPVLARIEAAAELTTTYRIFVAKVPSKWNGLSAVRANGEQLTLKSDTGAELLL